MAIDNGIIDHDHQVLISIISDFIEVKPVTDVRTDLQRTLARLYHYANTHFAREETLQKASGYPASANHAMAHQELIARIDEISRHLEEIKPPGTVPDQTDTDITFIDNETIDHNRAVHNNLSSLLRSWILEHILKTDLPMRDYVTAMQPFAAKMPSLWNVKPVQLGLAVDTPDTAQKAFSNAKGWMTARFHDERAQTSSPQNSPPPAPTTTEHPVIVRLRQQAKAINMTAEFYPSCTSMSFSSTALAQVFQLVTRTQSAGLPAAGLDLSPSDARPYLRQAALFERIIQKDKTFRYRTTHAGTKIVRIFGDIGGPDLEKAVSPQKFQRWKLLIDGAIDFNAPLRVVSIAEAFGRSDLAVERLFVPFGNPDGHRSAVLVAASYDIALD